MDEVRLGIIGCGGMASNHMKYFGDVPRLKFTAATDVVPENLQRTVENYGVKPFDTAEAMLDSGEIDAVMVATPHYFHPQYSIAGLERGIHVLTEKPVSVTAKAAAEVNAVAEKHPDVIYCAMFQMRTIRAWKKIKQIVESGELGEIRRVLWVTTTWFRSQAYYNRGGWRGTWKGEGGGILTNQCPHNLDVLTWICGTPSKVTANVSLGKHHKIEVEDEVNAFLEFPNGATGNFIASTSESPGTNYFELVGDRGKISLTPGGDVQFVQTDESVQEFIYNTEKAFGGPQNSTATYSIEGGGRHHMIMENFVNAILDGEELVAPAVEGLASVELANAIIFSGLHHKPSPIPTDRDAFEDLLQELIRDAEAAKMA